MHAQGPRRAGGRAVRQPRYDAGDQRHHPAPRQPRGPGDHPRLPRRAGDRARQPPRPVRSALSARRTADPARTALRGVRAHRRRRLGGHRAGYRRAARSRGGSAGARHRSRGGFLHERLRQSPTRGARGRRARRAAARRLCDRRHRALPRVVRVRAHRHGGRQRLCGPAGVDLCPPARRRTAYGRIFRHAVHDGLQRRRALGRSLLPPADLAGGIGPHRRLHRRGGLCRGAGVRQRHLLRHGRHHREMRAGGKRTVLRRFGLLRGRLHTGLPHQGAGHRRHRGRARAAAPLPGSTSRTGCMSDRVRPDRRPDRCATAAAAKSRR